jgi:DNA-binding IclR family transcriptional regulator
MPAAKRTGTQSIERAMLILREISTHGKFGWRLGEIAERCNLDHGTTHRILACLVREGMVQQRESNGHYIPGPLIFELNLTIPHYSEFQQACHESATRLAKKFKAASVFYLRNGFDWVCATRSGPAVYGGTILEVGTRRPLLSSAGGAAILLALPENEAQEIVEYNKWQLRSQSATAIKLLERMLRRSRSLGYAYNKGEVSQGSYSYGIPVRDSLGQAFSSLTVGAKSEHFQTLDSEELLESLQLEARNIAEAADRILPV